ADVSWSFKTVLEKPVLVSVQPEEDALNVPANTDVVLTFNKAMDITSGSVSANDTPLPAGTWSDGNKVYTIASPEFAYETFYVIEANGFMDTDGLAAEPMTWRIITKPIKDKEVKASFNFAEKTDIGVGVIGLDVIFDKSMDPTKGRLSANGMQLPAGTWSNGNTTYTVSSPWLEYDTNYVIIASGFVDADGVPLGDVTRSLTSPKGPIIPGPSNKPDSDKTVFELRTLLHAKTGVTATGQISTSTQLIVATGSAALHEAGCCTACDAIRMRNPVVCYNISIPGGYRGEISLYIPIPVDAQSALSYSVLHCNKGVLEEHPGEYLDGGVTSVWKKLSPFAVVADGPFVPDKTVVDPPKTGNQPSGWLGVALLLLGMAGFALLRRKSKAGR
ncbi:Ig-like domain-containing protein, partial [Eubacteriales bacterium OttesenSCG-928-K08]|nr:Ig-like domain-containing protein [Eubacteriales bacterium OttesenSCG-928-K08]